ncbi:hypothetical protein ADUPG1_011230, partial [Aduncisulcus paluster]
MLRKGGMLKMYETVCQGKDTPKVGEKGEDVVGGAFIAGLGAHLGTRTSMETTKAGEICEVCGNCMGPGHHRVCKVDGRRIGHDAARDGVALSCKEAKNVKVVKESSKRQKLEGSRPDLIVHNKITTNRVEALDFVISSGTGNSLDAEPKALTRIAENSKIRGYAAKRKKRAAKLKLSTDNPEDNKDTKNTAIFVVPEEKGYDIPTKPQKRSSGDQRTTSGKKVTKKKKKKEGHDNQGKQGWKSVVLTEAQKKTPQSRAPRPKRRACLNVDYTQDGDEHADEFVPTPDLIPNKNPHAQNLQGENPGTQQDKVGDVPAVESQSQRVSEEHRHETTNKPDERSPTSEAAVGDRESSKTEKNMVEEEASVDADSEWKPGEKRRTGSPKSRNKLQDEHNLLHQSGEDLDEDTEFESCMESGVVDIIHEETEEFSQVEFLPIPMNGEPNHSTQGEEEQQPPGGSTSARTRPSEPMITKISKQSNGGSDQLRSPGKDEETTNPDEASPANIRIDPVTTSETNASVPPLGAATERPQPTTATAVDYGGGDDKEEEESAEK